MAAKTPVSGIKNDMSCFMCSQLFKQAVSIRCGHNFCRKCVTEDWEGKNTEQACPICGEVSSLDDLRTNHTLNTIVEKFVKEQSQASEESDDDIFCSQHFEKLKLYCLDDNAVICCVCQTSKSHENHLFHPVEEVAEEYKERMKNQIQLSKGKLDNFEKARRTYSDISQLNENQVLTTEEQIKKEFEELHQFLNNEEKTRLSDLKTDKEQKRQAMEKKIKYITSEITDLIDRIGKAEDELKQDDVIFLKNFEANKERMACTLQDLESTSELTVIDVEKYLRSLKHNVCKTMLSLYTETGNEDVSSSDSGMKTAASSATPVSSLPALHTSFGFPTAASHPLWPTGQQSTSSFTFGATAERK